MRERDCGRGGRVLRLERAIPDAVDAAADDDDDDRKPLHLPSRRPSWWQTGTLSRHWQMDRSAGADSANPYRRRLPPIPYVFELFVELFADGSRPS